MTAIPDRTSALALHVAGVQAERPGRQFGEGRLAGAVHAQQADPVAHFQAEIHGPGADEAQRQAGENAADGPSQNSLSALGQHAFDPAERINRGWDHLLIENKLASPALGHLLKQVRLRDYGFPRIS
jgi:hypothetical protein